MASNIRNLNAENTKNAVHFVLARHCQNLDKDVPDNSDSNDEKQEDTKLFEQMLVSDETSAHLNRFDKELGKYINILCAS